jgi:hypothetical protein
MYGLASAKKKKIVERRNKAEFKIGKIGNIRKSVDVLEPSGPWKFTLESESPCSPLETPCFA